MGKHYTVMEYDAYACQVGESYDWDRVDGQGWEIYDGSSIEDAKRAVVESMGARRDAYRVIRTKYGLDTVEYGLYHVCEWDGDDCKIVDAPVTLPEDVAKAMEAHQREYWDFLDYETDSYGSLA